MSTAELPEIVVQKLEILREKLHVDSLDSALDKSLDIANYIADTIDDPTAKLLVERNGKYQQLWAIS